MTEAQWEDSSHQREVTDAVLQCRKQLAKIAQESSNSEKLQNDSEKAVAARKGKAAQLLLDALSEVR